MVSTSAFLVLNSDLRIDTLNDAASDLIGRDSSELEASPINHFLRPVEASSWSTITDQLPSGATESVTVNVRESDGQSQSFSAEVSLLEVEGQSFFQLCVATKGHPDDASAPSDDDIFERIVEQSHQAIAIVQDHDFVYVNERLQALTGRAEDELLGRHFCDVFSKGCQEMINSRYSEYVNEGNPPRKQDVTLEKASGAHRSVELEMSKISFRDRPAILTTFTDVTERKRAKRQAERNEKLFRDMAGALQDCFWIFNHDFSEVLYVNEAYEDIFGRSVEDFKENPLDFLENALDEDIPDLREKMNQLQQPGDPTEVEMEWRIRKDGEIRWLMSRGFVFSNADGSTDRVVGYTTDITERKRRTRELEKVTRRLQLALEKTSTGIWEWDIDTNEVIWDEQTEKLFGYEPGQFPGTFDAFRDRVHPDDREEVETNIQNAVDHGGRYEANFRITRPDGTKCWIKSRGTVIEKNGKPDRMLGIQTDITDLKEVEEQLQDREEMFRQVANNVQEVVWMAKPGKREHIYVNPLYEEIWGQSVESLYEDPMSFLDPIHPDDRERVKQALPLQSEGEYDIEYRVIGPEGTVHWINDHAKSITDENGEVYRVVGIAEDITRYKKTQQELREAKEKLEATNKELEKTVREDELTGLPNRRYFNETLSREWARSYRSEEPISLLMIDIDRFKSYNDTFGHTQGDEVLQRISEVLEEKVKRGNDLAARFGGEEFSVILPDTTESGARHLAEAIRRSVEDLEIDHSPDVSEEVVTVSVGVQCLLPETEDNYERLIREADEALYGAKSSGRNTIKISDKEGCREELEVS